MSMPRVILALLGLLALSGCASSVTRGTGDLGVIVERASGRVQLVDTSTRASIGAVPGLGDLSHASVVYSRDGRYAYVFGRDGGLSKVDLLAARIDRRIVQGVLDRYRDDGIAYHALRTRRAGARRFVSVHILVPGSWTVQTE